MATVCRHARLVHRVARPVTVIGSWTTTKLAQSTRVAVTFGAIYGVDWGDGSNESFTGIGGVQVRTHTYGSAGTYNQTWWIADATKLLRFECYANLLSGLTPSLRPFPNLTYWDSGINTMTGGAPSLNNNLALVTVYFNANSTLGGGVPSINGLPNLQGLYMGQSNMTGIIEGLTAPALVHFQAFSSHITDYTPSTLAATLIEFDVHGNLLPLAALKLILADFLVSAAGPGRPAVVTISLGGTGNAALDAAALATKAAILALQHGWVITNN